MVDKWTNPTTANLRGENSLPLQQTFSSLSTYLGKLDDAITAAAASGVSSIAAGAGISVSAGTGAVTVANTGVTSVAGTGDQISVSAATGGVTLSLPATVSFPGAVNIAGTGSSLSFGSAVRQMINLWSTTYGIGVQSATQYFRSGSNFAWYSGGAHNDAELNAGGGTRQAYLNSSGLHVTGYIQAGATGVTDAGSISTGNWFRSTGGSGWYNQTYGGGIYMQDSTYIRTYGSKWFLAPEGYAGAVQYGSYGSATLRGSTGGYAGWVAPDVSSTIMWSNTTSGHYRNNNAWSYYFDNGVLYMQGNSYYSLTMNNNNNGLPWHYGPTLVGYNGWSYYSHSAGQFEMGHRHATGTGHIYAWIRGGLIIGSSPNDSMAGAATLTIAGSAAKSSGGTSWAIYSDERFKDNIELYNKGLSEIVALIPKSFVFNGKNATVAGEKSVGLIAQEVQTVFPDAVTVADFDELDDVDNPLLLNFNEIQFAMINAIKELNDRVVELENAN